MSNGWVDINQYNGPADAYAKEQSFAWRPGPSTPPLDARGRPAAALPGVPGHYITGDYEATLRNQGFTPAQAAVLSALNTWRWRQLGAQQTGGTQNPTAQTSSYGTSLAPSGAPAQSIASLPTDPRLNVASVLGGREGLPGQGGYHTSGFSFRPPAPPQHPPPFQTPPFNPRRRLLDQIG